MTRALARGIVCLAAWIVPADVRERWREEWLGEIEGQRAEGKGQRGGKREEGKREEGKRRWKILRAALGSPRDALLARWTTRQPGDRRWLIRTRPGALDLKMALRAARATPLLSLTAVGALAVGIGLATAAFAVVNAAFYSQLRTPDGTAILALKDYDRAGGWELPITLDEFARRRSAITSFSDLAAYTQRASAITLAGQDEVRHVGYVTANIFRLLGVAPVTGRDFGDLDTAPGHGDAALIGEPLARQRFQSTHAAVGQILRVDGQAYMIVGVVPASCRFPFDADAWVMLQSAATSATSPSAAVKVVGRAPADVSIQTAEAELVAVASQAPRVRGEERAQRVVPFGALASGPEAQSIGWSIVAALVILLLVSAANVANLLLARAAARQREFAVRTALGASRARIVAGLVLEALVLATAAAAFGTVGAQVALRWFARFVEDLPYWVSLDINWTVLGFAAVLACAASLLAGVGPALKLTRGRIVEALRQTTSGIRFGRLSATLIVCETALAVGLLAGAASIVRGLVGFGYQSYHLPEDQVLITQLYFGSPPALNSADAPREPEVRRQFWRSFLQDVLADRRTLADRVAALPGVREVSYGWLFPGDERDVLVAHLERTDGGIETVQTHGASADVGYFAVLNAKLIAGRGFSRSEIDTGAPVVLVNEPFVRKHFGVQPPIGRRVRLASDAPWSEIVGVVPDLGLNPGNATQADGIYFPVRPESVVRVAILVDRNPQQFVHLLHEIARSLPLRPRVQWSRTLAQHVAEPVGLFRGLGVGLVAMGGVALLLACAGLHAIVAFSLAQRRRELAIRVALGAGASSIVGHLFSRTLRQLVIGVMAGAVLTVAVNHLLGLLPFKVARSYDLLVVTIAGLLLAGAVACAPPLRRALALRPLDWLRDG